MGYYYKETWGVVCLLAAVLNQAVVASLDADTDPWYLRSAGTNQTMTVYLKEGDNSLKLLEKETKLVTYYLEGHATTERVTFAFVARPPDIVEPIQNISFANVDTLTSFSVKISPSQVGKATVELLSSDAKIGTSKAYLNVNVYRTEVLNVVSSVLGWVYFLAWSVSFYPQIFENYRSKCVVGLSFDFLCLNIIGFFLYSLYNVGLYWIPQVQDAYMRRHQTLVLPVKTNDVFFGLHAIFACAVTIYQCFIYERGNQKISRVCRLLVALIVSFLISLLISAIAGAIVWLDFLLYASYVKLFITIIKYIPQSYMNFVRRSTAGWSIGNVLLDFTGGFLSMGQMMLDSYNFDDWTSFFGDPTKFGLGLFSVAFDILFILQHYVCFKQRDRPLPAGEPAAGDRASIVDNEELPPSYQGVVCRNVTVEV